MYITLKKYFSSGPRLKEGQVRSLQGSEEDLLLLVGLGKKDRSKDSSIEGHDLSREAVRTAISKGKGRNVKREFSIS